jgi:hypothetical protein
MGVVYLIFSTGLKKLVPNSTLGSIDIMVSTAKISHHCSGSRTPQICSSEAPVEGAKEVFALLCVVLD